MNLLDLPSWLNTGWRTVNYKGLNRHHQRGCRDKDDDRMKDLSKNVRKILDITRPEDFDVANERLNSILTGKSDD
jgi:hypothetical protein